MAEPRPGYRDMFADSLNGYWKTWLQFVFPVYIWIITAFIIAASHYSSMAAKTFGNNSVPVLATLFLLSYAKLLRAIITVLNFTFLDYPDGSRQAVWSYDTNVPYFSPPHTTLFLVALGFLGFHTQEFSFSNKTSRSIRSTSCYNGS